MTVEDGIESEEVAVRRSETHQALRNNEKLDDVLHVVLVVSNPCEYKRRWILAKECERRLLRCNDITVYMVELVYGDQVHRVTKYGNPRHLRLRTTTAPLWHKENMVNIGVRRLLPPKWKAMAWVDADIDFENHRWADDALRLLNGYKDVVQLFSHAMDMDRAENTMQVFHGFGFQHETGKPYCSKGVNYFHPGFAWAITRPAYERLGGLFELGILGAGDNQMALALLGSHKSINSSCDPGYTAEVKALVARSRDLRLGYVPGVIRHFFHGSKKNRKYSERWQILVKHRYDPGAHITVNADGLLVPTDRCPPRLLTDILEYFRERKEDD